MTRNTTVGVLAHVDSGKTTLSEAMLYQCKAIRTLGRVDHKNTYLDTDELEKARGITIYSKQARFSTASKDVTLLDTPGHVDFSSETERTLSVLDMAILVISGSSGVQSHTETLWRLLRSNNIPTVLFINKMDLPNADRETLLLGIHKKLSDACMPTEDFADYEELAMCSDKLMEEYLETNSLSRSSVIDAFKEAKLFPCIFGSALKGEGIKEIADFIDEFSPISDYKDEFGAKIYKISHDENGARLTFMKITGGELNVKDSITYTDSDGNTLTEKAEQIRIYHGEKYTRSDHAKSGEICAVLGLSALIPGFCIGSEKENASYTLSPVLNHKLILPKGLDTHTALSKLRVLSEEDPAMRIGCNEQTGEIYVLLMGEIQIEVLKHKIKDRFGFDVDFGIGSIVYKETITNKVEGIGHYEPLRHYSEVHLVLEPAERGSGIIIGTDCDLDELDRNWQRLILTHLEEKKHLGVLTGSEITDIKITLVSGKAHKKHTEGGDFRQSSYRAVRQGLMKANSILLEPWYSFEITVPGECAGRVMTDVTRMCGRCEISSIDGDKTTITGECPVSEMSDYSKTLASFTKGKGSLNVSLKGYDLCHDSESVIAEKAYNPLADTANSPDSIFCASGAGFLVPWDSVEEYMHLPSIFKVNKEEVEKTKELKRRAADFCAAAATDKELMEIFEKTYGPIRKKEVNENVKYNPSVGNKEAKQKPVRYKQTPSGPEYLLIDGYNIIYSWDELKKLAGTSLEFAREALIERLCNYQGFSKLEIILVFDAYKVKKNPGSVENFRNIKVVYTKEAETADTYIEKASYKLSRDHIVRVATSDGPEQMIILGNGALRLPALSFIKEVTDAEKAIRSFLDDIQE